MPGEIISNEPEIRKTPALSRGVTDSSIITLIGFLVTRKVTYINSLFGAMLMGSAGVASHIANSLFRDYTYGQYFEKAFSICTILIVAEVLNISLLNTLLISSISIAVYAIIQAISRAI